MKCKICRNKFIPRFTSLQRTCESPECMIAYSKQYKKAEDKRVIKDMRERVKTLADYKRELTKYFNRYIRLRDIDKGCISCNKKLTSKYDAGHYLSRGAFPNLAYDELNVHAQCVKCNQHLSGNLIEYSIYLPLRIGQDKYNALMSRRHDEVRLTKDECIQKINYYKALCKKLTSKI